MKLVKNTIAAALCAVCTLPALAADDKKNPESMDFYGKINISIQQSDYAGKDSYNDLRSNASRVGVKGKYKLTNGLTAFYKLEWQVNIDSSSSSGKNSLTARNQYVGLRGGFGEVALGRMDTTLKSSQGSFDLFNDFEGDIKHVFIGENRVTDAITYKSPKFNNVQVLASYFLSKDNSDPYSVGLFFGDLKLKKKNFYLGVAHDENMPSKFFSETALANTRVTGMYKFGNLRIGGMIMDTEISDAGQIVSETGFAANLSYKMGKFLAKTQYQDFGDANSISVGVDYKLGKKTKAFVWYTDRQGYSVQTAAGDSVTLVKEGNFLGFGMQQKF